MENFSPYDDLSASPVHSSSSPDFTVISLPLAVAPTPPRTKKGRRGKYDPERDYSAEIRRRLQQSPRGKRTARACDRCKVCNDFTLLSSSYQLLLTLLSFIHTIGQIPTASSLVSKAPL
jgi:hypothetical protein